MGFTQMNVTFSGPFKSLEDGYRVEAVKTLKANGENAQIAWNSELDLWIFCSKNVAMLAKTEADLEKYTACEDKMRYNFSNLKRKIVLILF